MNKEEKDIENIWLELIEKDEEPQAFLDITKELLREKKKEFALNLLKLLIVHYVEKNNYTAAITIQKEILRFEKSKQNTHQLIKYYEILLNTPLHKLYKIYDEPTEKKIKELMNVLDKYLYFNINKYFLHRIFGVGKLMELNINEDKIRVAFKNRTEEFKIHNEEIKYLEKISADHFLVTKYEDMEKIKYDAINKPVELMKLIIKSYEEITEEEIKKLLNDVVDNPAEWLKEVKQKIKKEKEIKIWGARKNVFTYLPEDKIEEEILQEFEKADMNKKIALLKEIKDKFDNIYQNLVANIKKMLKELPIHQATEVIFFLYDMKELPKEDLEKHINSKSIDELFDILVNLKSVKYKKSLFDYIIKIYTKETLAQQHLNKICLLDKELFEHFIKISDKDIILGYFNNNYKLHPAKFLQFVKYYKIKDKEILIKLLDVLYTDKTLRKYAYQIIDIDSITYDTFTYDEASDIQTKINEIFLDDMNSRLKIKISLQKEHPELILEEDEIIYATALSIKKMEEELEDIKNVKIPENIQEIAKAKAYGDLSENYEYKAARERQSMLYTRLNKLQDELKRIVEIEKVISEKDSVSVGKKVILKANNQTKQFTILGIYEADVDKNIIYYKSPLAKILLGKKIGAIVDIEGEKFEIIEIEKCY